MCLKYIESSLNLSSICLEQVLYKIDLFWQLLNIKGRFKTAPYCIFTDEDYFWLILCNIYIYIYFNLQDLDLTTKIIIIIKKSYTNSYTVGEKKKKQ